LDAVCLTFYFWSASGANSNYIICLISCSNFKLTKIRRKDVIWNCQGPAPYNIPYDLVSLLNRKGWQQKGETNGALEGNVLQHFQRASLTEST
jgi:hypothetical protein